MIYVGQGDSILIQIPDQLINPNVSADSEAYDVVSRQHHVDRIV